MTRRRFYAPPGAFTPGIDSVDLGSDEAAFARRVALEPRRPSLRFDGAGKSFNAASRKAGVMLRSLKSLAR